MLTKPVRVCVVDARDYEPRARIPVGAAPAHIGFSPDGDLAFIGCGSSDRVAVVEPGRQRIVDLIEVGHSGV